MKTALGAIVSGLLGCFAAFGQSQDRIQICNLRADGSTDCPFIDTSVMGGVRFEDYKVTNPGAVQFDPAQRLKELAGLGTSTANTLCRAPPSFTTPAPTITFRSDSVRAQIYYRTPAASFSPSEFMDVQFANFTASNGYTSQGFGFRMIRQEVLDGSEVPQFNIQLQAGNAGLENVAGLPALVGFSVDPLGKNATVIGTVPSSALLREAILGVLLNAQSILNAAKFTVTNPAPAGKTLWSATEIVSLAGQAQPWILAATDTTVPLGPPFTCKATLANGYGVCDGQNQIDAFTNMILTWGGEYLGLRTQQSFNVLVSNLRAWAAANAPSIDPAWAAIGKSIFMPPLTKPTLMVWPTLRADPALSDSDRQTIENWVNSLVSPRPPAGWYSNDLGYFAESVNMAAAIGHSDDAGFAQGIAQFYGALNQMRADGSFPFAAGLSACSATYSNVDLLHLTSIAEMAATQGYDLYSMSVDGKKLETAIEFMLNARENPALLSQYSKAAYGICFQGNPGDPPDFTGFSGSNLAWAESYIARFPFSTTAARLRTILGSNVGAPPFPLANLYTGLNATCAFRQSQEFQPVNGAQVTIVSGNGQTAAVSPVPTPLAVRVTDNAGKALTGALVNFAVVQGSANMAAPAQVLTDAAGMAGANVTIQPGSAPVTVTAAALGAAASFSITVPGLAIYPGGIAGIGASVPAVTTISPGALFSIYGQNFVPAGAGRRVNPDEMVNGMYPTALLGVCVTVGGSSAPLLDVYPGQINAVAPAAPSGSTVQVTVTTGCGTSNAVQSLPRPVTVETAAAEFLYFTHNANGQNPVAAVNAATLGYVGPANLGTGFAPAHPGDVVAIYASGFGPTKPPVAPGAVASGVAQVTGPVTVTLGSVILAASDVLYAGAAPGEPISQLNIRIPSGISAGNQPLQIQIGGSTSPPGAFLAIAGLGN